MKTFPFPSYSVDLPEDVKSDIDGRVSSFWMDGRDGLLQLSSYTRQDGPQVGAAERLMDRLSKGELTILHDIELYCESCEDFACKSGVNREGVQWIYCYAVWPNLTVFATISGLPAVFAGNSAGWAFSAVRSLKPSHKGQLTGA